MNGQMNIALAIACMILAASTALAGPLANPQFNIVKPSTTGIPGEEVRVMTVDPQGNLWIAGRWPFWVECAVAMLPPEEQLFNPLPGGGFDTGKWSVWSNVHHPIPSVFIDDIEFTSDNIMWIASEGGLTRFNRHAAMPEEMWQTWNAANSPLNVNGVSSLDSDANDHLWLVNSQVNGPLGILFEFDPASETWIQHSLNGGVQSVTVGLDGHIYVTHELVAGFSEFDGAVWSYHGGGTLFGGAVQDFDGNLWFSASSGLWKWNGSSYQSFGQIGGSSSDITGISVGLDGTVYVSTWYGPVFKMIGGTRPEFFVDAQGLPRSVIQRPNGDLFINNYGSTLALGRVRHYDQFGGLLRRMNTYNCGLPDYFIDNIQSDTSGHLWFACGEGGLSRMDVPNGASDFSTNWRNWGNHNDFAEPNPWAGNEPMYSMKHAPDGTIWMGGNGIGQWDPTSGSFLNFWNWQNSNLGVDSFVVIEQDGNGDMWVASDYTGAYRLNPQTNDWEQHLFGAAFTTANYVSDMVRDHDGNLWVSTLTSLHVFNGTTWFAIGVHHGSPVVAPTCLEVHPDDGSLWIGASNGLIRYADATWTIYDTSNSPIPTNEVKGLDIRDDGLIAFTVADFDHPVPWPNGVVLFDGKSNWQIFSYGETPLPHYQLGDVEFDADGDLWVSTVSEGVTEIVLDSVVSGDIDGDGKVDVDDLLAVINAWGACPPPCEADVTDNGVVDVDDLLLVINNWT